MGKGLVRRVAVFAAALAVLGGCSGKTKNEETYYNGYLGLRVAVPAGVYLERNEENLTESPSQSLELEALDISPFETAEGWDMEVLYMESESETAAEDHAALAIFCEYFEDYPLHAYLVDYEYLAVAEEEGYTYKLLFSEETELGGQEFTRLEVEALPPGGDKTYREEYFITQRNGLFLVIYLNYWTDSEASRTMAQSMLSSITFE